MESNKINNNNDVTVKKIESMHFILKLLYDVIQLYLYYRSKVPNVHVTLYFCKLDDILSRASHAVTLQSNQMWVFAGISTIKSYNARHKETLNRVLR